MAGTRDARRRILEATADLVTTRGLDAATPAAIAERADAGKMSLTATSPARTNSSLKPWPNATSISARG